MIDIHCHLLPGIDDGCPEIECSMKQLRILADAGITRIYFTPHHMLPHYSNPRKKIVPIINEIEARLKKEDIQLELLPAAEFFLESRAPQIVEESDLGMGNSRYVLVETMMQSIPADFMQNTYELQKAGYKVILAHPERYLDVVKNPDIVEEFMHHDIYLQLNAGSFIGFYGNEIEKTAYHLLDNSNVHFIASDNHGTQKVSFQKEVYQLISENYSPSIADLLLKRNPAAIADGSKIKMFNHWRVAKKPKGFWENVKGLFTLDG